MICGHKFIDTFRLISNASWKARVDGETLIAAKDIRKMTTVRVWQRIVREGIVLIGLTDDVAKIQRMRSSSRIRVDTYSHSRQNHTREALNIFMSQVRRSACERT